MKERITGAAILVLIVVLVVPVFLDGPPTDTEIVSERVLLPGQDAQTTQTVVLDRNRTEPVPSASSAPATPSPASTPQSDERTAGTTEEASPAPKEKPEPAAKVDTPPPEPEAKPPPVVSATGMWAVQLGSFSSKENAEKLAADLRKEGYAAFLSQLKTDAGVLHRVRIGPQKDRDSAEETASRLQKAGHKGQVVPHP